MWDRFEWDPIKAESNRKKHGVTFEEAATVFDDPQAITVYDERYQEIEERFFTIGLTTAGRLVVVAHTDRDGVFRIISARKATKHEETQYIKGTSFDSE